MTGRWTWVGSLRAKSINWPEYCTIRHWAFLFAGNWPAKLLEVDRHLIPWFIFHLAMTLNTAAVPMIHDREIILVCGGGSKIWVPINLDSFQDHCGAFQALFTTDHMFTFPQMQSYCAQDAPGSNHLSGTRVLFISVSARWWCARSHHSCKSTCVHRNCPGIYSSTNYCGWFSSNLN